MAPRGPRAQVSARAGRETGKTNLSGKSGSRGGIQKRKGGATRTDGDGDLDMDSVAARGAKSASTRSVGSKGRSTTRAAASSNTRGASRTAQTVLKHLNNGDVSSLASRITNTGATKPSRGKPPNLTYLRVHGLKGSKAASNPDGGLKDLLAFLERKASSLASGTRKRNIMIKKVCYSTGTARER